MLLYKRSRSIALWLIVIFGAAFANAQTSPNDAKNSTNDTETKNVSAAPTGDLQTNKNKNRFGKITKNSFSAATSAPENGGAYKKQDKGNNREFGVYAGSFTFYKDLKGESQKAPVVLFGLRYAWTTKNNPSHRLRYYMDFDPLIIVNYRERRPVQTSPTTITTVGERRTVFGVGFTPVGLQFNWRNSRKYQPYIAGGFGVAVFNRRFPDNRSPL